MTFINETLFPVTKLMELHGEGSSTTAPAATTKKSTEGGEKVEQPDNYEPPVMDSV